MQVINENVILLHCQLSAKMYLPHCIHNNTFYEINITFTCILCVQTHHPSQTRTLDHYLFTGWPDYGVPKYPTSLIRMLYHVRDARVSDVPILVHCR